MVNTDSKKLNILEVLKKTSMSYSDLKSKCGYRKENSREFVNLLKLGLRLNLIRLERESRVYRLS